jgi:threonine dehydrogenase-like Zn-dependent dehydrogenase
MTEHSFHGIHTSRFRTKAEGVTHVSGTIRHPCLGPVNAILEVTARAICGSDLHLHNGFLPGMKSADIM